MGFFRRKSKKNKVVQSQPSYASPWAPVDNQVVADTEFTNTAAESVANTSPVSSDGIINHYDSKEAVVNNDEDSAAPLSPSPSTLYNVITSSCSNGIELGNHFDVDASKAHNVPIVETESVWSGSNAHGFDMKYTKKARATALVGTTRESDQLTTRAVNASPVSSAVPKVPNQALVPQEFAHVDNIICAERKTPTLQTEGAAMQFDPPMFQQEAPSDSPPIEKRANKSYALRKSMFREIVRHRGKSVDHTAAGSGDHKQAGQSNEPTTLTETTDANEPVTDDVSAMQKISMMPGRTTSRSRDECASRNSVSTGCTPRDEPAVENTGGTIPMSFPDSNLPHVDEDDEVGSIHGSSCWSCGGPTDDEADDDDDDGEDKDNDEDDGTATYNDAATYHTIHQVSTSYTGDENVVEGYDITTSKATASINDVDGKKNADSENSNPPAAEDKDEDNATCKEDDDADSLDDEVRTSCSASVSYDGSYDDETLDGTLDGSLNESFDETLDDDASDCDDDVSEGTRSVSSDAKGGLGWSWFGFGGKRDDDSMSQSGYTSAYTRQSTVVSVETMDETIDDTCATECGDSVVSGRGKRSGLKKDESTDELKNTKANTKAAVAHFANRGNASSSKGQLRSKHVVRGVPRFKKSWKKRNVSSGSGVSGGDKSIASEDTPATASVSKDSNKESVTSKSSSKAGRQLRGKRRATQGQKSDAGQVHLLCVKNDGATNFSIRQYNAVPVPSAPNHVLIKVEASTVSLKDCIKCGPASPSTTRFIPGLHIIGKVHAFGASVNSSTLRLGDRVAALLPDGGGNAKYISIPLSNAILLPDGARHEDIICLVANYMTAYQCLKLAKKNGARLNRAKVLVTNASRPVGQAIVELALKEGAKVYVTAHKMHEDHLTKLGAKCFNVKPNKWLPHLEGKMDVVVDNLYTDGYEASYRALKPTGILVCNTNVALKNGSPSFCNAFDDTTISTSISSWWNTVRVKYLWSRAVFYDLNESYQAEPETFANELHRLIHKLERGDIKPKVAGRVSLNQVPKAQLLIEKGLPNGTVICLPWKELDPNQKVKVRKINV